MREMFVVEMLESVPFPSFVATCDGELLAVDEDCSDILGIGSGYIDADLNDSFERGRVNAAAATRLVSTLEQTTSEGVSVSFAINIDSPDDHLVKNYAIHVAPPHGGRAGQVCQLRPFEGAIELNPTNIVESLNTAIRQMFEAESEEEVFHIAAKTASDTLGFHGASARRYVPAENHLEIVSYGQKVNEGIDRPDYDVDSTPHGEAFRQGQTLIETIDDNDEYDRDVFEETGYVPIGDYGIISIGKSSGEITHAERRFAETVARNAAAALNEIGHRTQLEDRDRRLEAFTSVLTHDLRNALTIANGYLQNIDAVLDGDATSDVAEVEMSLSAMRAIIDDLRLLAGRGRDEQFDVLIDERVSDVISTTCAEASPNKGFGSTFVKDTPDNPQFRFDLELNIEGDIYCDPQLLRRLFGAVVEEVMLRAQKQDTDEVALVFTVTEAEVSIRADIPIFTSGCDETEFAYEYGTGTTTEGSGFRAATIGGIADIHGWDVNKQVFSDGGDSLDKETRDETEIRFST